VWRGSGRVVPHGLAVSRGEFRGRGNASCSRYLISRWIYLSFYIMIELLATGMHEVFGQLGR